MLSQHLNMPYVHISLLSVLIQAKICDVVIVYVFLSQFTFFSTFFSPSRIVNIGLHLGLCRTHFYAFSFQVRLSVYKLAPCQSIYCAIGYKTSQEKVKLTEKYIRRLTI